MDHSLEKRLGPGYPVNFQREKATPMDSTKKLEQWFNSERRAGRVTDLKFFPGSDPDGSVEQLCKAVYETVTGERSSALVDVEKELD